MMSKFRRFNPNIKQIVKQLNLSFLETLAPRHCHVCNQYIGTEPCRFEYICDKCADKLPLAPKSSVIMNKLNDYFSKDELAISNCYSLFSVKNQFEYIQIVYGLKYSGFTKIGREFGLELGRLMSKDSPNDYHGIVPVPIHHARLRERGFNQSKVISDAVSSVTGVQVRSSVGRIRYTTTQTKLNSKERRKNVADAFFINKSEDIRNCNILLVDDVLTTGSTLNAIATKLLEGGCRRVDVATLALAH